MKQDDSDRWERLRATDEVRPFDAEGFAKRVVAERSHRHARRVTLVGCALVAVLLSRFVWYSTDDMANNVVTEPVVSKPELVSVDSSLDELPTSDVERQTMTARDELDGLLRRIEHAEATIEAGRVHHTHQMLAMYRAEASGGIEVPELEDLYDSMIGVGAN